MERALQLAWGDQIKNIVRIGRQDQDGLLQWSLYVPNRQIGQENREKRYSIAFLDINEIRMLFQILIFRVL